MTFSRAMGWFLVLVGGALAIPVSATSFVPVNSVDVAMTLTPAAHWSDRCPAPRLALLLDEDEPLRLMAEVSPMIAAALADARVSVGGFLPQSLHAVEAALAQRLSTEAVRTGLNGEAVYGVPVPPGQTWIIVGGPGGLWSPEGHRILVYRYGLYLEDIAGHRILAEPRLDVEFEWVRWEALGPQEHLVWLDIYRIRSWRQVADDLP